MAQPFDIPLHGGDIYNDKATYKLEERLDIPSMTDKSIAAELEDVNTFMEKNGIASLSDPSVFDALYCVVHFSDQLSEDTNVYVLEILAASLKLFVTWKKENVDDEDNGMLREQLKRVIFLMYWYVDRQGVRATERAKAKIGKKRKRKADDFAWDLVTEKEKILNALIDILKLEVNTLWDFCVAEDAFVLLFSRLVCKFMEDYETIKSKVLKPLLADCIYYMVRSFEASQQLAAQMLQILLSNQYVPVHLADILSDVDKRYNVHEVINELLMAIGNIENEGKDNNSSKYICSFLDTIAKNIPNTVLPTVSVVLPLLNFDNWHLRNGVINVVGHLLDQALSSKERKNESAKKSLISVLLDRFRDTSSYTRTKTLKTWSMLATHKNIPLKVYHSVAEKTIDRLKDKTVNVRKFAILLLRDLLIYNPYAPQLPTNKFKEGIEQAGYEVDADLDEYDDMGKDVRDNIKLYRYYVDAVKFIGIMNKGLRDISTLLGSKTLSDVQCSISLVVVAKQFNLEKANEAVKKMLMLVWSKDDQIKESILEAYVTLYLKPSVEMAKESRLLFVAKNLISLTEGATLGDITSFEELITMFMVKKQLPKGVVDVLWSIFEKTASLSESRGALIIICMLANADPAIISNKLKTLLDALGGRAFEDPYIAKYACIALQKLAFKYSPEEKTTRRLRYHDNHDIFVKLRGFIVNNDEMSCDSWFPAAEQAVKAIYTIAEHPDLLMQDVVKDMSAGIFNQDKTSTSKLSKFFFLLGQIALQQILFMEDITAEIKERSKAKNDKEMQKKKLEAIEEELGVVGNVGEVDEIDREHLLAQKALVRDNLLGSYAPIIIAVCSNLNNKFTDPMLRSSAVLALCKYMCASAEFWYFLLQSNFSEQNLNLLVSILQGDDPAPLRANVVIALGDLALRFPNSIQPYTSYMYDRLCDDEVRVRKNTLMVLTHLILNDMIKAQSKISNLALCLEDSDKRIRDLATLFFHELAIKPNALYNILPDIISNIAGNSNLTAATFQKIISYLFTFIEKDKQTESLVGKLCSRIYSCDDVDVWRDILYCLGLLNYTDNSAKKLADNFKNLKKAMVDDESYSTLKAIISLVTKSTKKEETIALLEEFSGKIEKYKQQVEGEVAPKSKTRRNVAKRSTSPVREEDSDSEHEEKKPKTPKKKSVRVRGRKKRVVMSSSSESLENMSLDDSSEEEEQLFTETKQTTTESIIPRSYESLDISDPQQGGLFADDSSEESL